LKELAQRTKDRLSLVGEPLLDEYFVEDTPVKEQRLCHPD
jgi:hypothetical protein